MPSSGYGITEIVRLPEDPDDAKQCLEYEQTARYVSDCAQHAMKLGLFIEWLESFVSAWEQTHDARIAANAGIDEWDM